MQLSHYVSECGAKHTQHQTSALRSYDGLAHKCQVHIAYVEIYNEAGYDLLDPAREGAVVGFADLPRVGALEDDEGRLHMRNLSLHCATTEEEALNLVRLSWLIARVKRSRSRDEHRASMSAQPLPRNHDAPFLACCVWIVGHHQAYLRCLVGWRIGRIKKSVTCSIRALP